MGCLDIEPYALQSHSSPRAFSHSASPPGYLITIEFRVLVVRLGVGQALPAFEAGAQPAERERTSVRPGKGKAGEPSRFKEE